MKITLTRNELLSVLADAYELGFDHHKDGAGFHAQAACEDLIDREAWS